MNKALTIDVDTRGKDSYDVHIQEKATGVWSAFWLDARTGITLDHYSLEASEVRDHERSVRCNPRVRRVFLFPIPTRPASGQEVP